jgi:hypothetical protein
MFKVTISEDGRFIDELEFDADNVVAHSASLSVVHRDVMRDCRFSGIWYRVAHAAGIAGRRGYLLGVLQAEERRQADIYRATIWMRTRNAALPRLNCSLKLDRCLT